MNYILFMPDSLRAESMACYGHPLVKTPNFDRLAEEGTLFENCYAQHPICGPSRCSLMTGLYPHHTGCRTNERFLHSHQPSLFKYLKEAGHDIIWFGKNDLYSEDYFTETITRSEIKELPWDESWQMPVDLFKSCGEPSDSGYYNFFKKKTGQKSEDVKKHTPFSCDLNWVHNAVDFLNSDRAKEKPFVLFLPLGSPHPPYNVREPYYSMYDPAEIPPLRPAKIGDKKGLARTIREYHDWNLEDDHFFRQMNSVYLGMVSFTDALLGMVSNAVDANGLKSNTAVFAFSDHGDYAGDYGLGHKCFSAMEDTMLRTPLIAKIPEMKKGHRVTELVENFDIMATILELEGIQPQHHHYARSLTSQLQGGSGDKDRIVFAEAGLHLDQPQTFACDYMGGKLLEDRSIVYHRAALMSKEHPEVVSTSVMMRTQKYKLIYRPDFESELYDMENDPRELDNLYEKSQYATLREKLLHQLFD